MTSTSPCPRWGGLQDAVEDRLQLPVFPAEFGLPDYYDDRYDRLFSAIEETGLPVCCHIGLNTSLDGLSRRDPTPQKGVMVLMTPLSTAEAFGMWILTGLLARHPKLKLVFVEPGLAWVAWWLHSADDMVRRQGYEFPGLTELPSHYFHEECSPDLHRGGFLLGVPPRQDWSAATSCGRPTTRTP